ncbi:MAG TPA: type II toxin-antitoxin system YhaV family toxin [Frateuria sp.]|uniref:type II toxin-antitoxin system YhaV family toxin n=1 Tax=Frateuria sp. TaxID=2211372 RepID=UPI002D7FDAAE|nr:type II toxin-antitoxin system YhaV family toxin [Frateuria sp.]HET6805342.1 type II toxin-antitoxin system YhaV family toxin [Frateuria sp.]
MPVGKDSDALVSNGWTLYGHPIFIDHLDQLMTDVEALLRDDPDNAPHHRLWKLLECVMDCILRRVPSNPDHADYRLGDTLGPANRHWRRAKKGMPQRYRLFFQYRSTAPKNIIYAWFNDEDTLRNAGGKRDCYAVFKRLVASGRIPRSYEKLVAEAAVLAAELGKGA